MQGDARVIELLNGYLQIELTGHKQYLLAAAACTHWGLKRLQQTQAAYAREETEHAEHILQRILLLEGVPEPTDAAVVSQAGSVEEQLRRDEALVTRAILYLRDAVLHCQRCGDEGSRALFLEMLVDEEHHLDWLEQQLELIARLGAPAYLQQRMLA